MEKQFVSKNNHDLEDVPMTDEELEAFALQIAQELPPEARETEVAVKGKPFDDSPSPLENFEVWKKHPATKARWHKNFRLVLAVLAAFFVMNLRVPVQWFLPAAQDIVRAELNAITADGGADLDRTVNAKDPAALLEALDPLYVGLRLPSTAHEETWDHYRAVFHLRDGRTVVFLWNWRTVRILYENGLSLELISAKEFGAPKDYNRKDADEVLSLYWKNHGIYKK